VTPSDPPPFDDPFDSAIVGGLLETTWLGRRHVHLHSCRSTNDVAAAEARTGAPEGLLVTADEQTDGRGRMGRTWHAPAGANLTFSLLLRPRRPAAEIPPITLLAGGALAVAVRGLGIEARLKWPNDLTVGSGPDRRKLAGILTEATTEGDRIGHVVVGIGLNVNAVDFPAELATKATSLRRERGGEPLSRALVLARVLRAFESAYDDFRARGAAAATELWDAHADRGTRCRARIEGIEVEGVAAGVDATGALLLRDDAGELRRVVSGEVI
jgi:BirA family transcriptional regulator, biotin operon repressor / biotin---[acetyl-CoA-carboxylase] ligase